MKKFYRLRLAKNKTIGTSLVELLAAVSILAVVISIAIPGILFLKKMAISAELDRLQIASQFLQKKAVYSGQKTYLYFNLHDHSYSYDQRLEKLSEGVFFSSAPQISGPPAHPKGPITQAVTFRKQKMTFYPNGTISPGTVYLNNQNQSDLHALTVAVSQAAFIRKYKYQAGTWLYLN